MKERHTSNNIDKSIRYIVVEWELSDELCGITTDNARNIVVAVKQLPWIHLPCIVHTLQLAVNAELIVDAVQRIVARCREIVGHFNA